MKLKNLEQELEFIRSAEPKELMAQIAKRRFSRKAEKPLIARKIFAASLFYIKAYGLCDAAKIEVFRTNTPELVAALLEVTADSPETVKLFLDHGEYNAVMKYLHAHDDVAQYPERELVWHGTPADILRHLGRYRMSAFARYDLIMRGNPAIIRRIITKGRLNGREKMAIMTRCPYELVEFLIETQTNLKEAKKLRQMQMIRFSSNKKLEKFIKGQRFVREAEDFFFRYGAFPVLVSYVKRYNIEGGQEMLLKRSNRGEIISYLSKHRLCEASEKLLLKRGIHAEIKAYIKKHCFSEEQEVRFIKRGNHREIMLYLANHSLCDLAQIELLYRRNNAEIMYFISRYPLADAAVEVLQKCGSDEAFKLWMQDIRRPLKPADEEIGAGENGSENENERGNPEQNGFADAVSLAFRPMRRYKHAAEKVM